MLRESTFGRVLSRRRWWIVAAVAIAAAAIGLNGALRAPAATPCTTPDVLAGSNFEIDTDANLKVDGAGDCIDWLADGSGSGLRPGVLVTNDKPNGTTDDSFGQGSQEDDANPTIVAGSIPPNKSDLKTFGLYTEVTAAGKFLELFWSRVQNPSGTTNMDFELNQKACEPAATPTNCSANGVTPLRTAGDKLITYDLSKGGTVPTISIRTWTGSAWGPATDVTAAGLALGSVNQTTIASADADGLGQLDPFTFGEAAISFDAIFPNPGTCGALGSAYLKSRSSDSFTSELKDFIAPTKVTLSNCTSLATTAQSPVTLGHSISDVAHLAGTTVGAGGTITFHLFSDSSCQHEITTGLTPVTVNGDGDYNSGPYTPGAAGSYYWIASYTGDAHNSASTGTCGDAGETSVVNKASSATATELHNNATDATIPVSSSVDLGTNVHDKATVSDTVSGIDPTGDVTFTFFSNGDCTGSGTSKGTVGLVSGVAHPSDASGALGSGDYSFRGHYAGDGNFEASTSDCEPFHVNKAGSSTATQLHNNANEAVIALGSSVALGTSVHDKAMVSDANAAFDPTGDVTFTFFGNGTCDGQGTAKGTVALVSGVAHPSSASTALAAGDYSFRGHYNGDGNFDASTSDCEPFHVNKAGSSTATQLHDNANEDAIDVGSSVALGTSVHDKAMVSDTNAAFDPTGDVTFTFFANGTCDGQGTAKGTVPLVSGVAHPSTASGALAAGDYSFRGHYNGDGNFDASTSDCEPFHVNKAGSSTATQLHNNANEDVIALGSSVAPGTSVHDKATVTDTNAAFDPTGDVSFTFFANNTCDGQGTAKGTVALVSGVAHPSTAAGALAAGDYSFQGHYNGDANFDPSTSPCEPFRVSTAATTTATELHNDATEAAIAVGSSLALGTSVHDQATVSDVNPAFDPTGDVTFTFFANDTCDGNGAGKGTVALVNAVAHPSAASGALAAGDYSFRAHYNGDGNFDASTSDCEPFHVNKAGSSTATQLHNNANEDVIALGSSVALGTSVHDKATVSDANAAFDPTGDVTFTFFANGTCNGQGTAKGTVALVNGVAHPSSASGALAAGDYSFRGHYNGDGNFEASTSDCEPFHVSTAGSTTTTELHNDAANAVIANGSHLAVGTSVHDKATVSDTNTAFDPTGDVTFTFFANDTCDGQGTAKGTVALVSGVAQPSIASGALLPGDYSFHARYNGNDNFDASTSDCEPFHVSKADSTTVTEVHDAGHDVVTSALIGSQVHDQATVTGVAAGGTPTGDVAFTVYLGTTDCDEKAAASTDKATVTLDEHGVAHPALPKQVPSGGLSYRAVYSGSAVYVGSTGACEPLNGTTLTPSVRTDVHNGSHTPVTVVEIGSTVHDSVAVGGVEGQPTPSGAVTFDWFTNGDCADEPASTSGNVTLDASGHADATGFQKGPLAPGLYGFKARYGGDAVYATATGQCEPLRVVDANIKLTPGAATNEVGSAHTFTAHVNVNDGSGAANAPAGTVVNFTTKSGAGTLSANSCSTVGASGECSISLNSNTPGANVLHASTSVAVGGLTLTRATADAKAGDSGDAVKTFVDANIQVTPPTANNPIGKNHTLIGHVNVNAGNGYVNAPDGTTISFSVTNAGGATAAFVGASSCQTSGGTGSCTVVIVSPTVGSTSIKAATDVVVAGVALHRASGDARGGDSADAAKLWGDATARTDILNASGAVMTTVVSGTVVHDKVFVDRLVGTPAGVPNPTGSVIFHRFTSSDCTGAAASNQTVALASGAPSTAVSDDFAPTANMSYQVEYLGDANYPARTAACEPLTVTPLPAPGIAIVKNPKSQSIVAPGTARFTITVTNTGNTVLTNVTVSDPLTPNCNRTSAQLPALASLAPGAKVTYTCSRPNVSHSFDNVATATGTPPAGQNVTASDRAPVKVTAPFKPPAKKKKPKVIAHKKPKTTG